MRRNNSMMTLAAVLLTGAAMTACGETAGADTERASEGTNASASTPPTPVDNGRDVAEAACTAAESGYMLSVPIFDALQFGGSVPKQRVFDEAAAAATEASSLAIEAGQLDEKWSPLAHLMQDVSITLEGKDAYFLVADWCRAEAIGGF
jgi:hypothetical protein